MLELDAFSLARACKTTKSVKTLSTICTVVSFRDALIAIDAGAIDGWIVILIANIARADKGPSRVAAVRSRVIAHCSKQSQGRHHASIVRFIVALIHIHALLVVVQASVQFGVCAVWTLADVAKLALTVLAALFRPPACWAFGSHSTVCEISKCTAA